MEESTINGADFRAARRELRGAMRGLAEGKVLAVIPMSSGGEIRVSVFAERGRPPLVSIGLCHRAGEDFIPDGKRASAAIEVPMPQPGAVSVILMSTRWPSPSGMMRMS